MSSWFTYDWFTEREPARFSVDRALARREEYPVALRLLCIDPAPGGEEARLRPRARRHVDALERKCLRLHVLLAGRVETASRMELYFYGDDLALLEEFERIAGREKLLRVVPDAQSDPDWTLYMEYLYPDAAKYQTEQNRQQIEKLRRLGDNTAAARRLRLHMFFPAEPLLEMFSSQARLTGFALGEREYQPEMERGYGIALMRIATLEKREVDAVTTTAIGLAQRYDGTLSHWDCPLIPKTSPLA